MAMEQIGFVAEVGKDEVKIRVERQSACGGNCAGCHGCPSNAVLISYPNDPQNPFSLGERVTVVMSTKNFFGGIMQSYGILILFMLAGAIGGYVWSEREGIAVLGGFLGLGIGGILVSFLGRRKKGDALSVRRDHA